MEVLLEPILNQILQAEMTDYLGAGNPCDFARLIAGHTSIVQGRLGAFGKSLKEAPDAPF